MSAKFERQKRYVVLKLTDVDKALTPTEQLILDTLVRRVNTHRVMAGKQPLQGVFVEQDWPEHEPTWAAIEARMTSPNVLPTKSAELLDAAAPLIRWLNVHEAPHTTVLVTPTSAEVQVATYRVHTEKYLRD